MHTAPARMRAAGFSLIELMIALILGLLVVAAAIGIFVSNRQAYRSTQSVGRMQESSQVAFELMARDIREAGANPCNVNLPVEVLADGRHDSANWWMYWEQPLSGYEDGALAGTVAGTDAIQLLSVGDEVRDVNSHAGTTFTLTAAAPSAFAAGDVLMVCDIERLGIFKASSVSGSAIGHAKSGGNCQDSFSDVLNTECGSPPAEAHVFGMNSVISRLQGVRWYVKDNGRGGRSLYRLVKTGDAATRQEEQEIAEGVINLQMTYLTTGDSYTNGPATWSAVRAVRVALTVSDTERTGTDGQPLQRTIEHVVTVRSRVL